MTNDIHQILTERGDRYGSFQTHAELSQSLKTTITKAASARSLTLTPDQQEALEMILHKIARIINGDPDYADSWLDIAGYATLVASRLTLQPPQKYDANSAFTRQNQL
ncbi:DUF6378 domain-containing protein [Extensimonas vulgaris]|uniref:DUF6378 domain-containing protein n=1 Tax=Extensimonas vulgaris TaxID=1031594 RepID=A0A369AR66_9BURK|nr:DUF6378 domain-containing protein [Extensimonas vulgaris]RCX10736.1 hypothetical protein DFR45_102137 [Extensimonas vulgaris]TWI41378.1 hypothetical protein IP95_00135 [Extensimonas vulgaris]